MSLIAITLGLEEYKLPYSRRVAGAKGGRVSHDNKRAASDAAILKALARKPMTAVQIAEKTDYNGWRGIRKKLPDMVDRKLITKTGRIYSITL